LGLAEEMFLNGVIEMDELQNTMGDLKRCRLDLEDRLRSVGTPNVISLHPAAAEVHRQPAKSLHLVLEDDDAEEVRVELRKLIERVDFQPLEGLGKYDLQVYGKLAALLGVSERATAYSNC
jgi:hypothetical protein